MLIMKQRTSLCTALFSWAHWSIRVFLVVGLITLLGACSSPKKLRENRFPDSFERKGMMSWYGHKFKNHRTANGERFNMHDFTAAHRSLPFGSKVRVRNARSGKS